MNEHNLQTLGRLMREGRTTWTELAKLLSLPDCCRMTHLRKREERSAASMVSGPQPWEAEQP